MNLAHRNRTLLSPKSIRPDERNQDSDGVTRHRERFARYVKIEAVAGLLEAEELGD
jgi:hypothetical protein